MTIFLANSKLVTIFQNLQIDVAIAGNVDFNFEMGSQIPMYQSCTSTILSIPKFY